MWHFTSGGDVKWLCKKSSLCPPCKRIQHHEREAKKKGFDQPEAPHEQWHTDISYIKVPGVFYYFISIMDGYSRKIPDWALCENMEGINIELLVARVKEKMAQWIDFYNNGRLHGALLYLTPADYFEGRKESRLAERREKLHTVSTEKLIGCNSSRLKPPYKLS